MVVTVKLNYLRIAPRKVRLVADLIRGKSIEEAQTILNFTTKKAAPVLSKLLKSAVANARNNFQLEEINLYIQKITVNEGPKLKRWRARARGTAYPIQKKTSHITIILGEIKEKAKKIEKIKKARPEPAKRVEKVPKKVPKIEKPKLKPELEIKKPKIEKGIKRIFRRKAF
ncbi:MAG: 50S ribosomal protein L22 [Candidatus Nealsonbacteria bacterium CG23_combo_of_CG06-09_8_20_14_all_36_12]|uniref:Large ribosomal subunit protein uL22 n=2 Tax=Candidatus Nealsoniibacteriota TaxID=1817911 RepID=A0A2H0TL30_9BACT|nr:MAG: 50S ribosomal protein L22 [Candidatus Nealsonbacteria bacterium CG23_combo_of_CG06-09_8_20_14_all_36_12]PIR72865.1 MAG: 50S ribosomal protein L22 [Candidatus Nealsonbacteria bacterium CG10_big_fil_rev_8_21_14_0_10_36_23]